MSNYKFPVQDTEAPSYAVYPYVTSSYRVGGGYVDNILSMFQLHTETVNVWSMLLVSIGSLYASFMINNYILYIFTLSAVLHLPLSMGYHLFMSMDVGTFNLWRRLDIIGIFNSCIMLTYSLGYYVFSYEHCLLNTLICAIVSLHASAGICMIDPEQNIDGFQQTCCTGILVLFYMYPMYYAMIRNILSGDFCTMSIVSPIFVTGILGFSGWAYATFWPQRLAPGRFNIWLHSHQIMHMGIIICHALEYLFILENMKYVRPLDFWRGQKQLES